jgi:hypothetical protein
MFSKEIQPKIIGQAVDIPMHVVIGNAIKTHIEALVALKEIVLTKICYVKKEQLALFKFKKFDSRKLV